MKNLLLFLIELNLIQQCQVLVHISILFESVILININTSLIGAVVEAKAQLVGIHERVRSDINGGQPPTSAALSTSEADKRVPTATNPNAEDAAELLRYALFLSKVVVKDLQILFILLFS